jgi:type I restriction enzyme S subunit
VREEWGIKTLGELCDVARGGSPRPIQKFLTKAPDGINWVKISDATASRKYIYETKERITPDGASRSRLVRDGDFILSNSMSFGRPYIMRTSGCIHDGWLVLSDKSGLFDQDYLYHFLASDIAYRQFDHFASGSTVRNLNIDSARRVKVPLPPLPEQKRIVAILDEALKWIDTVVVNTKKNLVNARELFDSYLEAMVTEVWKSCELVSLSKLATDITDGDHLPPPKAEAGVPFITIRNIDKETRAIDFANTFLVSPDYYFGLKANRRPKKGDVLYTVTGSFGIPVSVDDDSQFCFQRHIGLIRPNSETRSRWLYYPGLFNALN